ncbi:MAG: hypothetical protein ACPHGV_09285 [Synechococcus sp.]
MHKTANHFYRNLLIQRWKSAWSHLPTRTAAKPTIHRRVEQMVSVMTEQEAKEMLKSMEPDH